MLARPRVARSQPFVRGVTPRLITTDHGEV